MSVNPSPVISVPFPFAERTSVMLTSGLAYKNMASLQIWRNQMGSTWGAIYMHCKQKTSHYPSSTEYMAWFGPKSLKVSPLCHRLVLSTTDRTGWHWALLRARELVWRDSSSLPPLILTEAFGKWAKDEQMSKRPTSSLCLNPSQLIGLIYSCKRHSTSTCL